MVLVEAAVNHFSTVFPVWPLSVLGAVFNPGPAVITGRLLSLSVARLPGSGSGAHSEFSQLKVLLSKLTPVSLSDMLPPIDSSSPVLI